MSEAELEREREEEERREAAIEERKRVLQQRQARLSAIAQHPDWPEVIAEAQRYVELQKRLIQDEVFGGGEIDQRRIDYLRGLCDGYMAFVKTPGNAERALNEALADAADEERHRKALEAAEAEMHYA